MKYSAYSPCNGLHKYLIRDESTDVKIRLFLTSEEKK